MLIYAQIAIRDIHFTASRLFVDLNIPFVSLQRQVSMKERVRKERANKLGNVATSEKMGLVQPISLAWIECHPYTQIMDLSFSPTLALYHKNIFIQIPL